MEENGDNNWKSRNRLSELRQASGLTKAKTAEFLGVSDNAYSCWESGKRQMNYDTLKATAKLFHVSIDYILYNSDMPVPEIESNAMNKYKELIDEDGFRSYCDIYQSMTSEQRERAINILNEYMNEQYEGRKRNEEEEKTRRIRTEKATRERMTYFMLTKENSKRVKNKTETETSYNCIQIPITAYLKACGLSVKDVAREMGITASAVYTIGCKSLPTVTTIGKLATAMTNLGVPKTTIDVMNDLYCATETLSAKVTETEED